MAVLPEPIDADALAAELPAFLDADAASGEHVQVVFVADGEAFTLTLGGGEVDVQRGAAARPRVTLTLALTDLAALLTREADAAMLLLSGRLQVDGDERYAVALAGRFRPPGGEAAPLDVTDVDPDAIARIVRDTDRDQLRRVLDGPARELVLEEIFRRFPAHVRSEKIADADGIVGWKITGADGEAARYRVAFSGGRCLTGEDVPADARARVTIVCDGVTLLELVTGNANPVKAFLTRRLRVKGDVGFAAALPTWFRIPTAS